MFDSISYLFLCFNLLDFDPKAVMFAPHQAASIVVSDVGILLWFAGVAASIYHFGFFTVARTYLIPYLWCVTVISSMLAAIAEFADYSDAFSTITIMMCVYVCSYLTG